MRHRRLSDLGLSDHARWLVRATLTWWAHQDSAPNQPYRHHPHLHLLVPRPTAVRVWEAVNADVGLSHDDWHAALLLVELGFASVEYGFADDIHAPTGLGDDEGIAALRNFQDALRGRW